MKVAKDCVVSIFYDMKNEAGELLGTSENEQAVPVLFGHGGLLPKLEEALKDREQGDEFSVTLTPEDAWGLRDESRVARVPIKHLVLPNEKMKLLPGMVVQVNSEQGPFQATVLKAGKFNVDLDMNNPYAGMTVVFDIKVDSIREATSEELSHGHVHAPGGCGHDH